MTKTPGDLERLRTWLVDGHEFGPPPANGNGHHQVITARPPRQEPPKEHGERPEKDRAGAWLRGAGVSLAGLAAAAASVSYWAQFEFIDHVKHQKVVSYIQAGIPDIGALVFACLGIALALHGKRAIRARFLNVACVGISVGMNALASVPGWKPTAVWVMAPAVYAVASDTLIGVLRAYWIARHRALNRTLAADDSTPLQVIGAFLLWCLRLVMDPGGTVRGFRAWVLSTPASPRTRAAVIPAAKVIPPKGPKPKAIGAAAREGSKTARMIAASAAEADLKTIPVNQVSALATRIAGEIGLDGGAARAALLKHVRRLQGIQEGSRS
jgi:hypothetical protein